MRNALAIARKELSIYFTTPWAYVVFTAMVGLTAFWFVSFVQTFAQVQELARAYGWQRMGPEYGQYRNLTDGVITPLWGLVMILTLFVAPFLSMRLFAEEKRNKTMELLMTAPVRPAEIVVGKYLGGLGIITATLALTIVYPLVLSLFGSGESGSAVEWSTVFVGYAGLLLWGATCIAVGMFLSALTESQMLAALLTFVVLLPWWALELVSRSLDDPWRSIVNHLSFGAELQRMMGGMLETRPIVFFLSVIVFALVLTERAVESQRWA